jgi:hypothetical protein
MVRNDTEILKPKNASIEVDIYTTEAVMTLDS